MNKKCGLIAFVCMLSLLLVGGIGTGYAKVTGNCSNCHTMHNSQDGGAVDIGGGTGGNTILTTNCVGCHAQGTANHVQTLGTSNAPQVYHTSTTDLAGGNFGYIDFQKGTGASDTKGHNVVGIDVAVTGDVNLTAPPGDEFTTGIESGDTGPNFTCGGTYGCHGDRGVSDELASIKGAHHTEDTAITGADVGTSYRFLKGVLGIENNDVTYPWENYSATVHNVYKGASAPDVADLTSPGTNGTISGLCAECHGDFHGDGNDGHGSGGLWIRHPTDINLPTTGQYVVYNPEIAYDVTVPVAWEDPATPARAEAVVMCLSCHGVHGTDFDDILRWQYEGTIGMIAGGGGAADDTGCFKCHSNKDSNTP